MTGCASPDATTAPEGDETAGTEEPAAPAAEEEPPAPAGGETGAEPPEATAEVHEASRRAPVENVYAGAMGSEVREDLRGIPERVYVPNVVDGTVSVIDPKTFEIVDSYAVGELPYHVTPSWDMTELYVNNEASGTFTVIDPKTGRPKETIEAPFPYNFYYTPDGETAVVVAERIQTLEFRDADTWEILGSVYVPWPGVDHIDFAADGSYLLASSEWSGVVSKVDVEGMKLVDHAEVGGLPIDIKLSPDGSVFYVANQGTMGLSVIDPETMEEVEFIPTGQGAHGLQISRDTKSLYVSNRLDGTITVLDLATREIVDTWTTGGTPDMFQLSPDGRQLWVSGRFDGAVYVVDTETGELLSTIYTGAEPHGIAYFPNPGRFSLGHNGVYR
ncbi:beta-propeller fold lactonase family protein [Rubrobacter marinus]|uniref:Beta-propeller fold lactonase family protein n=1 Tax=Rubrobacter marinus TaxID=2653852 RepID=A0A6G8PTV3_9ACTN|nr:YncE family protein [Rubrobacter marinus]QIN77929.1 beta-propeller fold lactonase family protein [Rubrobacter marinus]